MITEVGGVALSAGSVVVFTLKGKELTGVILHDVEEDTAECSVRLRGSTVRVQPGVIISAMRPLPYVYQPMGSKLRTKIVWYSNSASFHGETWRVHQRGSHGVTWIEMPQWAVDVAFANEISTRWTGYGKKQGARDVAQLIVDKAIETGQYPFEMVAK